MGLFSDFISGAINSAINYNDKDSYFRTLCLVIYADSSDASTSEIEMATALYNTLFYNEPMIAVQIHKRLKSMYQEIYNSNKTPDEVIKDIVNGRFDRNKVKIFFVSACYTALIHTMVNDELNEEKLYMVYLIKEGFELTDDEVNDAYLFAKNNFGLDDIAYQNMVTILEKAFEHFENNK